MTENSDFHELNDWLSAIGNQFTDAQKRQLMRRVATKLKAQMAQRIKSQRDPDGAAFIPRKRDHIRAIRRGALFQRLSRQIKTIYDSNSASIGFDGRTSRVMRVHQDGLTAKPSANTRAVRYPIRQTVGFSHADEQAIINIIQEFLLNN